MKKNWKRIIALLCIWSVLGTTILCGNVWTVNADSASVTGKEKKVTPYTNAKPGELPDNIPEGYIFAGWYQDEACANVLTEAGSGYAKFVDENILRVKAQITANTTATKDAVDIRFVTTVDSKYYRNVGFEISINDVKKTVLSNTAYKSLYAVGETTVDTITPSETFCSASSHFKTYTIKGVPNLAFGTVITVRACWTTQDGTLVYGELAKKTVNMGIFETEAVDYGMLFNCDNKDYLTYDAGTVNVTTEDYKEGAGALEIECTEANDVLVQFSRTNNAVDISEYSNGYLHFWLYINQTEYLSGNSIAVELTSSGASDAESAKWVISTLKDGWNEIHLDFSKAELNGAINYEAINYLKLYLASGAYQAGLIVKLDDVRAVSTGQILNCDTMDYYMSSNGTVSLTTNEYKEGNGALQCSGSKEVWYVFNRENLPVNLELYSNGRLQFWLYVNNTKYLGSSNVVVELSSAAANDQEELQWYISPSKLQSGWNEIILPMAAPDATQGTIALAEVDYFRIYQTNDNENLVTILDDVRAIENEAQLVEPLYGTEDVVIADFIPTEMGYAVDATGNSDSTAGIQAALNDCYEAGGGTVYLPAGKYKITESINIPSYVTLRGDWQNPDAGTNYGTIISVEMDAVDVSKAGQSGVFELQALGGVIGLTVYYPEQSLDDVKIYPYTFYIVGGMLTTVKNVTVINGYRGIGATTTGLVSHESLQIENFKGTFLDCGIELYYSSDVGTGKNIKINNDYWLQYDSTQEKSKLYGYTQSNTTGIRLGDVEWSEFSNVFIDSCCVGIQTVEGKRGSTNVQFTGSLYDLYITNCSIGVQTDYLDPRWGMNIARGSIGGSKCGIINNTNSYIQLCGVTVSGDVQETTAGSVVIDSTDLSEQKIDYSSTYTKPASEFLIANLSEEKDASLKLQKCLDRMEKLGGGVVYVPGGTYSFYQPVTVPAGVELRGSSSIATRDNASTCKGTLFLSYYGDECAYDETAFITLSGENAGLNGIRIVYANNGPFLTDTNETLETTYAIKGEAPGVYVVNSMIMAAAYGVDFRNCDNHYIKGVFTCCYYNTFYLGGNGGVITACLQNPTVLQRTAAPVNTETWQKEGISMFSTLLYSIMKRDAHYIILEDAENELAYNNFAYGAMTMLTNIDSQNTKIINIGTDKVGASSAQLVMDGGSLYGVNILRSNTTSSEAVDTSKDGAYLTNGIASKSYKYIAGNLELHNRLLMCLEADDVSNEVIVNIENEEKVVSAKKTIISKVIETTGTDTVRYNSFLKTPVNLAAYEKGTLHLRLYINDKSYFTSEEPLYIEIGSSRRCDCEELQWSVPLEELQNGWNDIVLNYADATETGIIHMGAIDYFRIYHEGNSDELVTILDNVYTLMSDLMFENVGGSDCSDWSEWF